MAEPTTTQRRYPNMIGAGLVAGLFAGLAIGGWQGEFGLWVPVVGAVGALTGYLLRAYGGNERT